MKKMVSQTFRPLVRLGLKTSGSDTTSADPRPYFSDAEYQDWIIHHDLIGDRDRGTIVAHIGQIAARPRFTIIVSPVGTSKFSFDRCLLAVHQQLYPRWELIVLDVPAANERLRDAARRFAAQHDRRIKVADAGSLRRQNEARVGTEGWLSTLKGDYLILLQASDLLDERALYELAVEVADHPDATLLYFDEDVLDPRGQRSDPVFKPGWDPERILAQDYIGRAVAYRRDRVAKAGGFAASMNTVALYDLTLRVTEAAEPRQIRHVPRVLLHRARLDATEPPEQEDADKLKATVDALTRRGQPLARVEPSADTPGVRRVVWPLPAARPLVSVIIPTRDRADLLKACVDGVLERTSYKNVEIIICDNDSAEAETRALFQALAQDGRVRVLPAPGAFNYSAFNNLAAKAARGDILLLLNNDVEVIGPEWLDEMVAQVSRPEVGIVGAKLLYADGRVQHAGVICGPGIEAWHPWRLSDGRSAGYFGTLAVPHAYLAVTAACLAIKQVIFAEVGGLNEDELRVAYSDIDLCMRVRQRGYRVVWTPFAELFHLESVSRGQEDTPEKQARAYAERGYISRKWRPVMKADPNHNPNTIFTWEHGLKLARPRKPMPWIHIIGEVARERARRADPQRRRRPNPMSDPTQFNGEWYLGRYPDVAVETEDAEQHFMHHGFNEGRDPNPAFSTAAYLNRYPDVRGARVNPFKHYRQYGKKEGRNPSPPAFDGEFGPD